jgi:hypothetical protein
MSKIAPENAVPSGNADKGEKVTFQEEEEEKNFVKIAGFSLLKTFGVFVFLLVVLFLFINWYVGRNSLWQKDETPTAYEDL